MRAPTLDRLLVLAREALWSALLLVATFACDKTDPTGTGQPVPDFGLAYARVAGAAMELLTLELAPGAAPRPIATASDVGRPSAAPGRARVAVSLTTFDPVTHRADTDLYAIDLDGTDRLRLTTAPGSEDQPAWSPDGERIVYRGRALGATASDIWIMNADGSGAVNLTGSLGASADEWTPAWSPDGSRIAFALSLGPSYDIWTMKPDGTDRRQVTAGADFDISPSWSPDGARIAFRRDDVQSSDIFLVSASGGAVTRLPLPGVQFEPAWSPDGSLIAFSARSEGQGLQLQVFTMRTDGTDVRLRTSDPAWGGGTGPAWVARSAR